MNTTTDPSALDPAHVLHLVQSALMEQQITPSTRALCAHESETDVLTALQSAAVLDVLWDGIFVSDPDVSTVFWAQIAARLDEQSRGAHLLPYIDTQSTLFAVSVQPLCGEVLISAMVHLAGACAQTLEEHGSAALQEALMQLDENLLEVRTLLGEQFEPLLAPAYEALCALEAQEEQAALATCAQVLHEMLEAALNTQDALA
jgi:hypothetical protein